MYFQKRSYWCGPASTQIALRILGRSVSQSKLAELMNTTEDAGTDEYGIIKALSDLNCNFDELRFDHSGLAKKQLATLSTGWPIILCVDQWTHWVCLAGGCGERYFMFDPAREHLNKKTNGVQALTLKRLMERWRTAKHVREGGPTYYGIALLCAP